MKLIEILWCMFVHKEGFIDAKNRGVYLRYLTEITKDNLSHCKELIKIVHELRHLDGIKAIW